jgi:hypothetical protein
MVRDGVANLVIRLQECGFDPRRVGADAWEARCPAHRGADDSLAITRDALNHPVLECRSTQKCPHSQIVRALGIANDHVYAETPDWLIRRLSRVPIQPASFTSPGPNGDNEIGTSAAEGADESARTLLPQQEDANGDAMLASESSSPKAIYPAEREGGPALPRPRGERSAEGRMRGGSRPTFHPLSGAENGERLERPSLVQVLSRIASSARLLRSADGRFCAQVPVGDRSEIYGLKSAGFRDWLIDGYLVDQPEPPSSWAIRRVVGMLEARARFSSGIPEVFVRVGHGDDGDSTYFLDLGDPSGRAVAIREQGWGVVGRPGVHFRRPEGLLPLPAPSEHGSIDLLRPFVNLTEPDFRLMFAWLTAALRPVGPYPVLVLNGEQSSGKSTLARILRLLIDPQACPALALPKSTRDLMATALNGWLLVYENISAIAGALSDCICQLAFGGGFASRALFTNDERSVIYAQRPVILVGIDDFVLRGDLRDRSVFLHLNPIPKTSRRTERTFWPAFRADYPRILGGVLDGIVGALRELPKVDLKELPRMADYAEWGEATSRGQGWGAGTFLSTYDDNRKEATEVLLEDSPVATVVLALARKGINWSGTPMQLYNAVAKIMGKQVGPRWPKTIATFGNELRRIAPQLRLHGISVSFERRRDARVITLKSDGHKSTNI